MNDLARYILFIASAMAALWLVEHVTGHPLFDDADCRTAPYRHVTP